MNQRLINIYDGIAFNHHDKFLANEVEVDSMWSKTIKGVTLQIDLTEEVRDAVVKLQEDLFKLEPEALLLTPRPFQHISFNQVVYWGDQYKFGHNQTWKSIEEDFLTKFREIDNKFPSFAISFSKLIPVTSAIIWCAVDEHDEMQKLRTTFKRRLPFPAETTRENTFIHTTVARYETKLRDPHQVFQHLEKHQTPISMEVKEIILRKENKYPTLRSVELTRIRLK